jgi:hypothetical protein
LVFWGEVGNVSDILSKLREYSIVGGFCVFQAADIGEIPG